MWLTLLTNWKIFGMGAVIIAFFGSGVYVRGQWDESRLESKLKAQEAVLIKQCDDDKQKTTEVSRAYQDKIAALNSRIAALRVRPAKCVPVAISSGGRNGEASGAKPSGAHGIDDRFLIDYAAEAEKYRLQLLSCQDFVRKERQ